MFLREIIWKERLASKIESKHGVVPTEVEEILLSRPYCRRAERGRVPGEDLYVAYGRTFSGRYLVVFFILKRPGWALPISAREMTAGERKHHEQAKKS
jgi:hypothetical protein